MNYDISCYAHIKQAKLIKKRPCEDYHMAYQDKEKCIAVIADGHGDPHCYQAHMGAKLACFAAIEILKENNDFHEEMLNQLSSDIIACWKSKVNKHAKEHAIPLNNELYYVYGTTLEIVIVTLDQFILMNIGDGSCIVEFEDGTFQSLIPYQGISPDSLSDPLAQLNVTNINQKVKCIMMASDGGSSIQDEKEFIEKVKNLYLYQRLKFHRNMLGLVNYFASDDDVSMIWIYQKGV